MIRKVHSTYQVDLPPVEIYEQPTTTKPKAKRKTKGKTIFKGTSVNWFPVPLFFMGDEFNPGKFTTMTTSPELRLYFVLLRECAQGGESSVTLKNSYLMTFARLDRNCLLEARKELVTTELINATRAGMSSYRYEILDEDGQRLKERRVDEWGTGTGVEIVLP